MTKLFIRTTSLILALVLTASSLFACKPKEGTKEVSTYKPKDASDITKVVKLTEEEIQNKRRNVGGIYVTLPEEYVSIVNDIGIKHDLSRAWDNKEERNYAIFYLGLSNIEAGTTEENEAEIIGLKLIDPLVGMKDKEGKEDLDRPRSILKGSIESGDNLFSNGFRVKRITAKAKSIRMYKKDEKEYPIVSYSVFYKDRAYTFGVVNMSGKYKEKQLDAVLLPIIQSIGITEEPMLYTNVGLDKKKPTIEVPMFDDKYTISMPNYLIESGHNMAQIDKNNPKGTIPYVGYSSHSYTEPTYFISGLDYGKEPLKIEPKDYYKWDKAHIITGTSDYVSFTKVEQVEPKTNDRIIYYFEGRDLNRTTQKEKTYGYLVNQKITYSGGDLYYSALIGVHIPHLDPTEEEVKKAKEDALKMLNSIKEVK